MLLLWVSVLVPAWWLQCVLGPPWELPIAPPHKPPTERRTRSARLSPQLDMTLVSRRALADHGALPSSHVYSVTSTLEYVTRGRPTRLYGGLFTQRVWARVRTSPSLLYSTKVGEQYFATLRLGLEAVREGSNTGEPPQHQAAHDRVDHGLARLAQPLIILAHPPALKESQPMVRSATQRLGRWPRNFLGSGGSLTHSNHTVERSSRSPRGCHSPRALGG
jgi:hypothetical protein